MGLCQKGSITAWSEPSAASFPPSGETPGGAIPAVWDQGESVTPAGSLVSFAQFFQVSRLWSFAVQMLSAVRPALRRAWILGEDVSSRIVYGTQEGAIVGSI